MCESEEVIGNKSDNGPLRTKANASDRSKHCDIVLFVRLGEKVWCCECVMHKIRAFCEYGAQVGLLQVPDANIDKQER